MGLKESSIIQKVKHKLVMAFEMVDMGPISFYWGLKVEKNWQKKTLKLSQPIYINKILTKYHFQLAKPSNTAMKEGLLSCNEGPEVNYAKRERYQGII